MSDGKLFCKAKSAEVRAELEQAIKKNNPQSRLKVVLKKIIANIILNNGELATLFPDISKIMKYDDLELRKLCFHYITAYAPIAGQAAVDALPFLKRFVREGHSPQLKALALKTLSSVANKPYLETSFNLVPIALRDEDAQVRKAACFAVARLYQYDPKKTIELRLIDELNDLLYDESPTIVSNALAALSSITDQDPNLSLKIDKRHAFTLASYLGKVNEWCQSYILTAILSYVPQTAEDSHQLIQNISPSLQHESTSVVLSSIRAILYLSNYLPPNSSLFPSLSKKIGSSLLSLLAKPAEIQFLVLRNVILLLLSKRGFVTFDVQMFFFRYDESIYVKDTKLEIIYLLANESNYEIVLRELQEYALEVDISMARKAVRAIGNLAIKSESALKQCVDALIWLCSVGSSYLTQECVISFKNIFRRYPGKYTQAINTINFEAAEEDTDSKCALIWIIGQHCLEIEDAYKVLEKLTHDFLEDPKDVQLAILTAVTKFYIQDPIKGESLVVKIMKLATEEINNPDVRDRAFIYWRLLSSQQDGADFQSSTKKVVLNSEPTISTNNDNIDPSILEELELNMGTLASIYLKPVQSVFRLSKKKTLVPSPALQKRASSNYS